MKKIQYLLLFLTISSVSCKKESNELVEIPVTVKSNIQLTISIDGNIKRTIQPLEIEGFDVKKGSTVEFKSSDISNGGIAPRGWVDVKTPGTSQRLNVSDSEAAKITITR